MTPDILWGQYSTSRWSPDRFRHRALLRASLRTRASSSRVEEPSVGWRYRRHSGARRNRRRRTHTRTHGRECPGRPEKWVTWKEVRPACPTTSITDAEPSKW